MVMALAHALVRMVRPPARASAPGHKGTPPERRLCIMAQAHAAGGPYLDIKVGSHESHGSLGVLITYGP